MIRVEYNKDKCIGAGNCVKHSKYFKLKDEKAELEDSKVKNKLYIAEFNDSKKDELVRAGETCPVNAIRVLQNDKELVTVEVKTSGIKEVKADVDSYDDMKEFVLDKKGYFLIRVNREKKRVELGHCNSRNEVDIMFYGDNPLELYMTIIKSGLVSELGHAAYLGREVEKACLALKYNLDYVQDDPLKIR